ncbi:hypothetical protein [Cyclobacterium sp.]|uniref:hypothetical protein n=1 Tax=Cyclobacterium sp. TaxID=1966343 RepID=UPI00199F513F|nr:hypothetical protein [Cyclobacterium sp.]MBD3631230.1 hypothetical protein [Cyclobacterium sp.]
MKSIFRYILFLFLLSCNLDNNRELQIDQSYEGEEAYWVSKSMDEHLHLAFYDLEAFKKKAFTDSLPGCPSVLFSTDSLSLTLNYDQAACEDAGNSEFEGSIQLQYSLPSPGSNDTLQLNFQNYHKENTKVQGARVFYIARKRTDSKLLIEETDSLLLVNNFGSSTRIRPRLEHQAQFQSGVLTEISSSGDMTGRNWSGNEIMINLSKTTGSECLSSSIFRPTSGSETWTILRTGGGNVIHELVYSETGDCETKTTIRLSEGVVMEKSP